MSPLVEALEADLERMADSAPQSLSLERVHQRIARRRQRRLYTGTISSLFLVTALIVGLVSLARPQQHPNSTQFSPAPGETVPDETTTISPSTVATSLPLPDRGTDFVAATDPPLLSMQTDGWTLGYVDDTTSGHVRLAVVDAVKGFAGGTFVVLPTSYGGQLGTGTTIPTTPTNPNPVDGIMTGDSDAFRWFEWHLGDSLLSAHSRHVSEADAVNITSSIARNPDGSLIISSVPAGMLALTDPETANLTRHIEYQWTSPDTTRKMGLTLAPGGDIGVQISADGSTDASPTTFNGKPAFLTNGGMAVVLVDGFWVWTISGEGYTDSAGFLADAQHVSTTDVVSWEAELAGHAVLPSQRPEQVAEILSDIPLPPGFDTRPLTNSTHPKVRYQLVAEVTAAVFCAWAGLWDAALAAGDTNAASRFASTIASSTTWHALHEIADQGGFAEVMWDYSARVTRGDRGVIAELPGGLGCG